MNVSSKAKSIIMLAWELRIGNVMNLYVFYSWSEMSGSMVEMLGATPRIGRRSMALADIDPKYVSQVRSH